MPWYRQQLTPAQALGAFALVLYVVTGLPMPWWGTALTWISMVVVLGFLVRLSPWTFAFKWHSKLALIVVVALIAFAFGQKGVRDEYAQSHPQFPDVTLRFVGLYPALQVVNLSNVVAKEIKYQVVLFNLSHLTEGINQPLPIPAQDFDFLPPHSPSGNMDLFSQVPTKLLPNDKLLGSASVLCPECSTARTFVVYIEWGKGGWYAQIPGFSDGHEVRILTNGSLLLPKMLSRAGLEQYASDLMVKSHLIRIPIQPQ